ncbi:MAG: serine/threonine-protein phosphatase [Flavobacteriales bacterium]|jgi:sigma-B regulation protein RsbU (phosphoserine phosphatase)|nr:serine/threonine-protein phosphatase [Flavobacteriales bacterium]
MQDERYKVARILELTKAINANAPEEALFMQLRAILTEDLELCRLHLLVNTGKGWREPLRIGSETSLLKCIKTLSTFTDITFPAGHSDRLLARFEVCIPIFHKELALGFLLIGDNDTPVAELPKVLEHINFIQACAHIVCVALENKRLARNRFEQMALQRELQLAESIQRGFLPAHLPSDHGIQTAVYHRPHHHVGGDYYDLVMATGGLYYGIVADVSGKGIPAALLMSNLQAAFRALVKQRSPLSSVAEELHERVCESTGGDRFVTAFLFIYSATARILEYINCAHPAPFVYDGSAYPLEVTHPGLGMIDGPLGAQTKMISLEPDSWLCIFTDGLTDDQGGPIQIDEELMQAILVDVPFESPELLNKKILEEIDKRSTAVDPVDDITLFSLRFI